MATPLTLRADVSAETAPPGGSAGSRLAMAEGGVGPGDGGPGPGSGPDPGAGAELALVEGSAGRAGRVGDPGDLVALAQQVQQVRAGSQLRGCGGSSGLAVPLPPGRPRALLSRRRPWCFPARPAALRWPRRPPGVSCDVSYHLPLSPPGISQCPASIFSIFPSFHAVGISRTSLCTSVLPTVTPDIPLKSRPSMTCCLPVLPIIFSSQQSVQMPSVIPCPSWLSVHPSFS